MHLALGAAWNTRVKLLARGENLREPVEGPMLLPMKSDDRLVYSNILVDMDVDAALRAQAAKVGVSTGEMCRRYLKAGLKRVDKKKAVLPASKTSRLGMRSVYLAEELDAALQDWAWQLHAAKADVVRMVMREGMKALQLRRPSRLR
jgi:polysaccharide pyruvyl transferase WcaK-like protein